MSSAELAQRVVKVKAREFNPQIIMVDTLIKNGHVIDPENDVNKVMDLAIKDKKVFATGENLEYEAASVFDASGCIITAGLIDAHMHCYEYVTPLGVNPDVTSLSRGVTTVVDAGSAGDVFWSFRMPAANVLHFLL